MSALPPRQQLPPIQTPITSDTVAQMASIASGDSGVITLINNLALGLVGGFLLGALIGPLAMCGTLAAIGAGLALGGLSANLNRRNLSAILFAVLLFVGAAISIYGYTEMRGTTDQLNQSLNRMRGLAK